MSLAAGQKEREVVVVRAGSVDVVSDDEVVVAVPVVSVVLSLSSSLEPEDLSLSDSELLFELDTPTPTPTPIAITSAINNAASKTQKVLFFIPHLLESLGSGAGGAT